MTDYEKNISDAANVLGYHFYSCTEIQAFSDALYDSVEEKNGGREFFEGFPRSTRKEFFNDVSYWLGNQLGAYIWSYEYDEGAAV